MSAAAVIDPNVRSLRSRKLSLTATIDERQALFKKRKLDIKKPSKSSASTTASTITLRTTNNKNKKSSLSSRRSPKHEEKTEEEAKDIDSIEYVDRILRYYKQSYESILDENDDGANMSSLLSMNDTPSSSTNFNSNSKLSSPEISSSLMLSPSAVAADSGNSEVELSSAESTPGPVTPSSANNNFTSSNSSNYFDIPPLVAAESSASPVATAAPSLDDFISYSNDDNEDDEGNVSDSASSISDLESLENGVNGGAKFYNIFDGRKVASLDYRCHDKLNLALIDVAPRVFPAETINSHSTHRQRQANGPPVDQHQHQHQHTPSPRPQAAANTAPAYPQYQPAINGQQQSTPKAPVNHSINNSTDAHKFQQNVPHQLSTNHISHNLANGANAPFYQIPQRNLPGVVVKNAPAKLPPMATGMPIFKNYSGDNDSLKTVDYKTKYYQYLEHKYSASNSNGGHHHSGFHGRHLNSSASLNGRKSSQAWNHALNKRSMLSGKGNEMVGRSITLNELF